MVGEGGEAVGYDDGCAALAKGLAAFADGGLEVIGKGGDEGVHLGSVNGGINGRSVKLRGGVGVGYVFEEAGVR